MATKPETSQPDTSDREAWRRALEESQQRDVSLTTVSGREIEPLYVEDGSQQGRQSSLGYPGQFPFTRGIHPNMYRGRLWTMRQFAGFGAAAETNQRFKFLLEKGQTGLSTAFDLPTLMGLDSDHPTAAGEVGRLGVAIDTIDDFARLFDGINLRKVSLSMTINAPAAILGNTAQHLCHTEDSPACTPHNGGVLRVDKLPCPGNRIKEFRDRMPLARGPPRRQQVPFPCL